MAGISGWLWLGVIYVIGFIIYGFIATEMDARSTVDTSVSFIDEVKYLLSAVIWPITGSFLVWIWYKNRSHNAWP